MRDPVDQRRAVQRARAFRHCAILVILFFFDALCYVTNKAEIGSGFFTAVFVLYVFYLLCGGWR